MVWNVYTRIPDIEILIYINTITDVIKRVNLFYLVNIRVNAKCIFPEEALTFPIYWQITLKFEIESNFANLLLLNYHYINHKLS